MIRRLFLTVSLIALPFAEGYAESPQDKMGTIWAKNWAEKNKKFDAQRDLVRTATLSTFAKAIGSVDRQKGLTPAARVDRRKELQAVRDTFERYGTFPRDDEFIRIEFDYFSRINNSTLPVSQLIDEVIEKGSKLRDEALEKLGLEMKAKLDEQLGGASRLMEGSLWHGELRLAEGRTIPYHLRIGKMRDGGLFNGHVEDNPGVQGNSNYDIVGQTRCLGVQYELSKSLRGHFTAIRVEGIVSGNRLIAKTSQVVGGGRPFSAMIVLKRVD